MNPVHNAQVCYFNNVWLIFWFFKKTFFFKQLSEVTVTDRPSELIYMIRETLHQIQALGYTYYESPWKQLQNIYWQDFK